jgi:hypothetical protein
MLGRAQCQDAQGRQFYYSIALIVAGAIGLVDLMVFATHWTGWVVMAAGGRFIAGAIWLCDEFRNLALPQRTAPPVYGKQKNQFEENK